MQTITYNTGRTYNGPQALEIQILTSTIDEFGFVFGKALFVDRSRHIAGTADFFAMNDTPQQIGAGVLRTYDEGTYSASIFSLHN